jgi:hypothetical protein
MTRNRSKKPTNPSTCRGTAPSARTYRSFLVPYAFFMPPLAVCPGVHRLAVPARFAPRMPAVPDVVDDCIESVANEGGTPGEGPPPISAYLRDLPPGNGATRPSLMPPVVDGRRVGYLVPTRPARRIPGALAAAVGYTENGADGASMRARELPTTRPAPAAAPCPIPGR